MQILCTSVFYIDININTNTLYCHNKNIRQALNTLVNIPLATTMRHVLKIHIQNMAYIQKIMNCFYYIF